MLRYLRALWLHVTKPRHCTCCRRHFLVTGPMAEMPGLMIICRACALRCIEIIDGHMKQQRADKPLPTPDQLAPFRKAVSSDPLDGESGSAVNRDVKKQL